MLAAPVYHFMLDFYISHTYTQNIHKHRANVRFNEEKIPIFERVRLLSIIQA